MDETTLKGIAIIIMMVAIGGAVLISTILRLVNPPTSESKRLFDKHFPPGSAKLKAFMDSQKKAHNEKTKNNN